MSQFSITELLNKAAGIQYQPQLAAALNRLLTVRRKDQYEIASKEAAMIIGGYNVSASSQEPASINYDAVANQLTDYGYSDKVHFAGLPLFQPLTLKGTNGDEDLLLEGSVVSFNRQKNIIQTVVQGRDSSVKEYINSGDYLISISGFMCETGWTYPLRQVTEFTKFMDRNEPIEITHEVLNAIGVYSVVVLSHDCQRTPMINCQAYTISCISDKPIQLIINDLETNQI